MTYKFNYEENEISEMTKNSLKKIKKKILELKENIKENYDVKKWNETFQKIVPELTDIEQDIIIAIGFEESNDITKLSFNVLLMNVIGCNK